MNNLKKTVLAVVVSSVSMSALAQSQFTDERLERMEHAVWQHAGISDRRDTAIEQVNDRQQRSINQLVDFARDAEKTLPNHEQRLDAYGKLIVSNAGRSVQNGRDIQSLQTKTDTQTQLIMSNRQVAEQNKQELARNEQLDNAQAGAILRNRQDVQHLQSQQQANHKQGELNAQHANENTQHAFENHVAIEKMQASEHNNEQAVTANTQHANENTQHAFENHVALEQQQARVASDEVAIASNSQAVQQEQRAIAQNSNAIQQNQQDIQSLREDMEKMAKNVDGAYAESAAFAGLVDPYGVGNVAVTAALGYHGDAQAVAVGIGERFNENFTAKLGGAYDTATESMSAYAGVGYEF